MDITSCGSGFYGKHKIMKAISFIVKKIKIKSRIKSITV